MFQRKYVPNLWKPKGVESLTAKQFSKVLKKEEPLDLALER